MSFILAAIDSCFKLCFFCLVTICLHFLPCNIHLGVFFTHYSVALHSVCVTCTHVQAGNRKRMCLFVLCTRTYSYSPAQECRATLQLMSSNKEMELFLSSNEDTEEAIFVLTSSSRQKVLRCTKVLQLQQPLGVRKNTHVKLRGQIEAGR